jgi:hydrogenase maturation protease
MTGPLVIGYGNWLRQDDGVGWRAADLLEQRLAGNECEIVRCHQLTPELAANLASARVAIFLDAAVDRPFQSVTLTRLQPKTASAGSSHQVTPEQLLNLSQALHGYAPRAYVVTAGLKHFAFTEHLTADGEACAARMAELAFQIICAPAIE